MKDPDIMEYNLGDDGELIIAGIQDDYGVTTAAKIRRLMWFMLKLGEVLNHAEQRFDEGEEGDISVMQSVANDIKEFTMSLVQEGNGETELLPTMVLPIALHSGRMIAERMGFELDAQLLSGFVFHLGCVAGAFASRADGGVSATLGEMFGLPWEEE